MKALVTGANGLIGAHLVRALLADGHQVRAFVRPTSDLRSLDGLEVDLAYGDVLRPETLEAAAKGCELLFHTAAVYTYRGQRLSRLKTIAVEGTLHAIEAAHKAGIRRMVFTSSSVVFGSSLRPTLRDESFKLGQEQAPPYVGAKVAQDRAAFERAEARGLELIGVCPTICVGAHDYRLGPSNEVIVAYLKDPFKITYPGGGNVVSVSDVARGHLLAARSGTPGERYLLGSENLEWSTMHRMISELCGVQGPYVFTNHTGAYLAATADEVFSWLMRKPPTTSREQAKMVGRYYWYSHARAEALGYAPRPAQQALAEAISWLVSSTHISRGLRASLKLSPEIYAVRKARQQQLARAGASR